MIVVTMLKLSVTGNCDHVVNIIRNCQIMFVSSKAYFFSNLNLITIIMSQDAFWVHPVLFSDFMTVG